MRGRSTRSIIPEPVDIIVCDASFIGLAKVLEAPLKLAEAGREAGRADQAAVRGWARGSRQGRGGARPGGSRARLRRGDGLGRIAGLDACLGVTPSPITGPEGNVEFLLGAEKNG